MMPKNIPKMTQKASSTLAPYTISIDWVSWANTTTVAILNERLDAFKAQNRRHITDLVKILIGEIYYHFLRNSSSIKDLNIISCCFSCVSTGD